MLAYVFWHWRRTTVSADDYQGRQRAFHAALAGAPSSGFLGSFSVRLSTAPWVTHEKELYEDWYLLHDFAALGELNEAAVSGPRAAPHTAAAAVAAGGAGGLFALQRGNVVREPGYAQWFGKPDGVSYRELFAQLVPVVDEAHGALWMRQLVLGPAQEFCLHAPQQVSLPQWYGALTLPLKRAWSG